ncbi:helix-turn-helix domain-containing protein [Leifsonia sp. Root227]|uniref:helix-turn-helix domain-containing protein n=1 Tax=Leifsonia sp. Root227 TaxID=1736496 RepID=UPI000B33BDDD|nr:helix-turn-helix transcriptional regulator [Leifsonia sp. Root227]
MPGASKAEPGALTRELAAILRAKIARDNVSVTNLAASVNVSRPQMSKLLSGQKQFDLELLDDICQALGLSFIDTLVEADAESTARKLG